MLFLAARRWPQISTTTLNRVRQGSLVACVFACPRSPSYRGRKICDVCAPGRASSEKMLGENLRGNAFDEQRCGFTVASTSQGTQQHSLDALLSREMPSSTSEELENFDIRGFCFGLPSAFARYDARVLPAASNVVVHVGTAGRMATREVVLVQFILGVAMQGV